MAELNLAKSKLDKEANKCSNIEAELKKTKVELKEAKEAQRNPIKDYHLL